MTGKEICNGKGDYNLQQKRDGVMRYDVGVDANEFYPMSICTGNKNKKRVNKY